MRATKQERKQSCRIALDNEKNSAIMSEAKRSTMYVDTHDATERLVSEADDREEVFMFDRSTEELEEAAENNMRGFCICCGHEQGGVPSLTDSWECEKCGEFDVYAADLLLWMKTGNKP